MENHKKHTKNLSYAIALALSAPLATAATFNVTEAQDDGTGLVANTLSWAILQANTTVGADIIELNTDVTITGVMKRLIDSDTTLQSDATRRTIDGNNQFRPLFIKSGQVTIQNLDIQNGHAEGGGASSFGGGRGAGLGGGVFVYDGMVSLSDISIKSSVAIGGNNGGSNGGGGLFGNSSWGGGGGMFGSASGQTGGYGGYGNYRNLDPLFGAGGDYADNGNQNGNFGGGGGYGYYDQAGKGGFGGGGGYGYYVNGGDGGFGAGGGASLYYSNGQAGYGGNLINAAGFGGAVFVRSGILSIQNATFENNDAQKTVSGPNESKGFGGALFIIHTTQNSNGNNQGMPNTLPTVTGCGVTFSNNTADTDPGQPNNNDDIFDLGNRIQPDDGVSLTTPCGPPDQEIQISGNGIEIIDGDVTPDDNDFTSMGQAQESGQSITRTFMIENQGQGTLILTSMPIVDLQNNSGQFSITSQPETTIIEYGEFVTFDVTFTPTSVGLDSATVVIPNNDSDEAPYDFVIEAEGIAQAPILQVLGNGIEILDGDQTPGSSDGTWFGYTPVNGGQVNHFFELQNIGYADLNLSEVVLNQAGANFSIIDNINDSVLSPGESTFVEVRFDPDFSGYTPFTAFEVYDDGFQPLHYHLIEGFGQSTITINAQNNYLQEGDLAQFVVERDVFTSFDTVVNWVVSGQVDGSDFGGSVPSGSVNLSANVNQAPIEFLTIQDGVYEGPEFFNIQISSTDPKVNIGFPGVSGGVIDDDLIFRDGFELVGPGQLTAGIAKYAFDLSEIPECNKQACNFLNRSLSLNSEQFEVIYVLAWFEETLVLKQPNGDWDGDGLPNHHDLNPFGLSEVMLGKIKN